MTNSILWRRLDEPGHEWARLTQDGDTWQLSGTTVFAHAGQPCRLDYWVRCNAAWETQVAGVSGWVEDTPIDLTIIADAERRWLINGVEWPAVAGCIDLDLEFSGSTNLLPLRRLKLAIGQTAPVRSAWLRFPSFALEPLEQTYQRTSETSYHYQAGNWFTTDLQVNPIGLVTNYPPLWQIEDGV